MMVEDGGILEQYGEEKKGRMERKKEGNQGKIPEMKNTVFKIKEIHLRRLKTNWDTAGKRISRCRDF